MKIFIVGVRGFPGVQGGVEKHCQELYTRIAKQDCEIVTFTRTPYISKEKRYKVWNNIRFKHFYAPRSKNFETIIHTFRIWVYSMFNRPDIVCVHNMGPALFIPLFKLLGTKVVFIYHSINYTHKKWGKFAKLMLKLGERWGLKFSDKIITISRAIQKELVQEYPDALIEYIPNGVNIPDRIFNAKILEKYDLEPKKYILTVSRISSEKGVYDLMVAFSKLHNPDYKLVFVGEANHRDSYAKRVIAYADKNKGIVLTGFLDGDSLNELYSQAALFVLPSYQEGMPIVLLEAMSHNLSVLLSDIPQHRDFSFDDERYFKAGDSLELSKKIEKFFYEGISQGELQSYRELIEKEFNWDIIAEKTYSVYKDAVNSDKA